MSYEPKEWSRNDPDERINPRAFLIPRQPTVTTTLSVSCACDPAWAPSGPDPFWKPRHLSVALRAFNGRK